MAQESLTEIVGANVPALGLSNKAITEENVEHDIDSHSDNRFQTHFRDMELKNWSALASPPLEYDLINGTLWPEVEKLYLVHLKGFLHS